MAHPRRWRILHDLREHGVELVARASIQSIDDKNVHYDIATKEDGTVVNAAHTTRADSVILAIGLGANPGVAADLEASGLPIHEIGDVKGVGYLEGAMSEGFHAALEL
jgi:predicted flavoprotein YhiN